MQTILIFFAQCLAVSLSIAIGIVFIYGCCQAINRLFNGRGFPCTKIQVKNFVTDNVPVEVKLSDGRMLSGQKFVGFADFGTQKVPFEFKTWIVLESEHERTFVKPQAVRIITEKKSTN